MDRQPGLHNKAKAFDYRLPAARLRAAALAYQRPGLHSDAEEGFTYGSTYISGDQRQKEYSSRTRDDEHANMADTLAAREQQDQGTALGTEDYNNDTNSGHGHNGNGDAKENDMDDPISSLLRSSNKEDDPFAWESEPDRLYAQEGKSRALSPPAHVLYAFGHVKRSQRLDIPERPDSNTVWFERMTAVQRQTLLSRELPKDRIALAFARMKDRIQMEALLNKSRAFSQAPVPLSSRAPGYMFYSKSGSTYSLQYGIGFEKVSEPWEFGREFRSKPEMESFLQEWLEVQRGERREQVGEEPTRKQQHPEHQQMPHLREIIPPQHLGPADPATTATTATTTAPGKLYHPTNSNELPPIGLYGISHGRVRSPNPVLTFKRTSEVSESSPFSQRPEQPLPYQVSRLWEDDGCLDRWNQKAAEENARVRSRLRYTTHAASKGERSAPLSRQPSPVGAQTPSPERDAKIPSPVSTAGWYDDLPDYQSDDDYDDNDNGFMQVDDGLHWAVANEAKEKDMPHEKDQDKEKTMADAEASEWPATLGPWAGRERHRATPAVNINETKQMSMLHTKDQNKEMAVGSEASEWPATLGPWAGRERHRATPAVVNTNETGDGNKDTAVVGDPSQPNNKTSSQLSGPGVVNPSPSSTSSSRVDVGTDVNMDIDADKLATLKESKMAPWEAMHSYLTIRRSDYPTAKAFLRACGHLRTRCRTDWGMTLTRSFATAHLIRAMRSHAPALAGALLNVWRAGEIDFETVISVILGWDGYVFGEGMQLVVGGRTLEAWGRAYDDEGGDAETVVGKNGAEQDEQQGQRRAQRKRRADDDDGKDETKGKGKKPRYTKHELTGSRDVGALGLNDEQIQEFGFTQEGPDEFSYGV